MNIVSNGFYSMKNLALQAVEAVVPELIQNPKTQSFALSVGKIVVGAGLMKSGTFLIAEGFEPRILSSWLWKKTALESPPIREEVRSTWAIATTGLLTASAGALLVSVGFFEIQLKLLMVSDAHASRVDSWYSKQSKTVDPSPRVQ